MKTAYKRILVCLLTIAMLLPALSTAAGPAFAALTSGSINNMDPNLSKKVISPAEPSLNMENNGGIRFATNINLEKYAALKKFCKDRRITDFTIGTLIAPLDYIIEANEFSTMALGFLDYKTPYLDIKANTEDFYDGEKTVAEGYDEQYVASIINIKLENRDRAFAAIGYIQLKLNNGSVYTVYSYDNQNMEQIKKNSTTLEAVATKALEKDTWTEEERAKIADLAAPETKLNINTTEVKDVRIKRNQVYFTYVNEGVNFYNRITYNGANGWRLQTNTKNYNTFRDIGASQSLALYLDEGFNDVAIPLTVTEGDGEIIITAEGTEASAELSYITFALDFCGPDGVSLYNVNGMKLEPNGDVKLSGKMNATDAVYGGGERFDASNNRGKTMSLYISDAYDTKGGKGTYVAIPLFSTSRGGGMFVNRYEPMTVSFPKKDEVGNWSLTINTEILDCYFYATGNIADVLQAYTDMTGHASLPEEWAQGYIVCRFQPDFTSLDGLSGKGDGVTWYYNITDIPNYTKFTYTPHMKLTADAVAFLKEGATIQSADGKTIFYTYAKENGTEDKNGNGVLGEYYFKTVNQVEEKCYFGYNELPNKEECYYDNQTKIALSANATTLCHKKTVSYGTNYFHYVIENENEDFNYNGITGETYFLRVTSKGGPAGAGVTYIVESLIDAGMTPTAVILEGVSWYNMEKDAVQWTNLKKFITRMDELGVKTLVYSSVGYQTGGEMSTKYKDEYALKAEIYEYDPKTGVIGSKLTSGTNIPKSDKTDNPDTTSDGSQRYIDITNPAAVKWYIDTVWDEMMDLGVDGVKIDFCESVPNEGHYTELYFNGTKYANVYLKYVWSDSSVFGEAEPHHAYAPYFISTFYKAMTEKAAEREGDTGFVVLARGGGIGVQRNPYMWAGDQSRRFTTLKSQLAAVINSGISGLPFMTYDMAGYTYKESSYHYYGGQLQTIPESVGGISLPDLQAAEEYESEIFVRALQYTIFGNLIQTHGDVRHLYNMTEEAQEIAGLYSSLHEELADYLQAMSQIACDTGMPMIRHMILEYQNDQNVADIDDQFMYGDGLLVAPILGFNTKTDELGRLLLDYASTVTREVYLPAGTWIDLNSGETIVSTGQTITIEANLAKIPVYLNTASEYAEELQAIFEGATWSAIKALANAQ